MSPSCSQFLVLDMRQQWQNRCVGNLPAESSHDKSRRPLFLGGTNGSQNPDCNYSKIIIYIYINISLHVHVPLSTMIHK